MPALLPVAAIPSGSGNCARPPGAGIARVPVQHGNQEGRRSSPSYGTASAEGATSALPPHVARVVADSDGTCGPFAYAESRTSRERGEWHSASPGRSLGRAPYVRSDPVDRWNSPNPAKPPRQSPHEGERRESTASACANRRPTLTYAEASMRAESVRKCGRLRRVGFASGALAPARLERSSLVHRPSVPGIGTLPRWLSSYLLQGDLQPPGVPRDARACKRR